MVIYERQNVVLTELKDLDKISAMDFFRKYKKLSLNHLKLKSGDICLDVGCGTGTDVKAMANIVGRTGKVYGIDINDTAIELAKSEKNGLPVYFITANGENIPLEDQYVDKARADRIFQHLENPEKVLSEMVRITKESGYVQVVDTEWDSLIIDTDELEIFSRFKQGMQQKYKNPNIGRQIYRMFKKQGLEDITVEVVVLVLTKYDEINRVFDFENYLEYVVENGYLDVGEAKLLEFDLVTRGEEDRLFAFVCGTIVTGRKPKTKRSQTLDYGSEYYYYYG